MNLSYFIAQRISNNQSKSFSSTVHKIAIGSIAVGLATMIVSFLILKGFQSTVIEKIYGFSGHLQITKYTLDNSFEEAPLTLTQDFYLHPENYPFIEHIQEYSHKAGLVKTGGEVMGMVIKGVSQRFDTARFAPYLIDGRFIHFNEENYSKEVVISRSTANKLNIKLKDDLIIHFFQNPPRFRKLRVVGIYETNLADYYDDKFIIGDIRLIRKLNDWGEDIAGGYEVFVSQNNDIDEVEEKLNDIVPINLFVQKVSDKYIQIFEWLYLISRQLNIFLGIILFVVCVNIVSIVLILIMERTSMIGLLKAMGATNGLIRKVFSYHGISLAIKGLVFGNLLGVGICAIQYFFKPIKLDPKDYYMSFVPIGWDWEIIFVLNILTLIIIGVVIAMPTAFISRINPIKSIKFD